MEQVKVDGVSYFCSKCGQGIWDPEATFPVVCDMCTMESELHDHFNSTTPPHIGTTHVTTDFLNAVYKTPQEPRDVENISNLIETAFRNLNKYAVNIKTDYPIEDGFQTLIKKEKVKDVYFNQSTRTLNIITKKDNLFSYTDIKFIAVIKRSTFKKVIKND